MKFEGWVANATGNLSFNALGDTLSARGMVARANFWRPDARFALAAQIRTNPDRLVPEQILQMLGQGAAKGEREVPLLYALTARSHTASGDLEGALGGTIHLIVVNGKLDVAAKAILANQAKALNELKVKFRSGKDAQAPADAEWMKFEAKIGESAAYICDFWLLRNGKCFIDTKSSPDGPESWLASQCYYFLKDSIHHHYHHNSKSDGIIELTEVSPDATNWRVRTLRNLYRKVIELRRSLDDERLADAVGVLSYARTFSEIFGEADYDRSGQLINGVKRLPNYASGLQSSIEIRREAAKRHFDGKKLDAQFFIISFVTIIAAFIGLYDKFPEKSVLFQAEEYATGIIAAQPIVIAVAIFTIYVAYSTYTGHRNISGSKFGRWVYRLSAPSRKRPIVWLGIILTLALICLSFCAYRAAWHNIKSNPIFHAAINKTKAANSAVKDNRSAQAPVSGVR